MKSTLLNLSLLLLVLACNGKNTSGKPAAYSTPLIESEVGTYNSMTAEEETSLRREYLERCTNALRIHREEISGLFGQDRPGLIRNRLQGAPIDLSFHVLTSDRNEAVASVVRNGVITLYVGEEFPQLNWRRSLRSNRNQNLNIFILHDVLELGDIDDSNYRYSQRMGQGQQPGRR
jgi:hypothetical protein